MMQRNKLTLAKTFQKIFRQNKKLGIKLLYHDKKRLWQFFRVTIDSIAKRLANFCKNATEFLQANMESNSIEANKIET